jgi:AraC family transcriptional regulator of arabinose operon
MDKVFVDYFLNTNYKSSLGLRILHAGEQNCPPNHCFGYSKRDHYLIHYILSGHGEYRVGKKVFQLGEKDGFLICPEANTLYKASNDDPWSYKWVGFSGNSCRKILGDVGLGENRLIFHYDKDDALTECFNKLEELCYTDTNNEMILASYLLMLFGNLQGQYRPDKTKEGPPQRDHFDEATKYIQMNYPQNIKIDEIARHVGITRSQLYRIFKRSAKVSPKEYLMNYRLDCSTILMHTTNLSFKEIADSVGFEYTSHFYRMFKKHFGVTPSAYKLNK